MFAKFNQPKTQRDNEDVVLLTYLYLTDKWTPEKNRTVKSKKGVMFGMKTWQSSICIGMDRYQVLLNLIWYHKLKCGWFWSGLYSWNTIFRLKLQASKISASSFRSIWSIEGWKPSSYLCNLFAQQLCLWNWNKPNLRLQFHYPKFFLSPAIQKCSTSGSTTLSPILKIFVLQTVKFNENSLRNPRSCFVD